MLIIETPNFKIKNSLSGSVLFRFFLFRCHNTNIMIFLVSKAITLVKKLFNPFNNINNTLVLAILITPFTIL
ncbi:hypothetical protein BFW94_12870 [Enterobacter ludwigii]|nr:hypothetical protein BFW94_12870 [Enterobacter ludwigii]